MTDGHIFNTIQNVLLGSVTPTLSRARSGTEENMKRFSKACGSIVLAASLAVGLIGVTPAKAASEAELTEFVTAFEAAKAATAQVAESSITQSVSNGEVSMSAMGLINLSVPIKDLTTTIDPISKKSKMTGTVTIPDLGILSTVNPEISKKLSDSGIETGDTKIEDYGDLTKKALYRYNSKVGRAEVAALPGSLQGTSILSQLDITKLKNLIPYLTITKGKSDITLNIKVDEAGIKAAKSDIKAVLNGIIGDSGYDDLLAEIKKIATVKDIDLTVKFVIDPNRNVLIRHDIDAKIGLSLSDLPVPVTISFKNSTTSSITTESVAIPEAFTKGAQLIANYPLAKGGAKLVSTLSGKKTVFSVNGVTKTSAKSITIPASVKVLGSSYSVTKAAKNAFKKATKLKKLTIKNKTLKKLIKKSPSKYGLKKSVKIK